MREYKCDKCGASNLKLWRKWFADYRTTPLLCASCCRREDVNDNGMHITTKYHCSTYIIEHKEHGSMCPAITVEPYEESQTFWGHTLAPTVDIERWKKLPTYKRKEWTDPDLV